MKNDLNNSFDALVKHYLGAPIPQHISRAIDLDKVSPTTQKFIIRVVTLMRRAKYSATGFTQALIRWMTNTVPGILEDTWGEERIPPLTFPERHKKLDDYVYSLNEFSGNNPYIFIDIGCGFPPVTSTETSGKLLDWYIYGVDRSFADYVLYTIDGHYVCFDHKGEFQYFQALMNNGGQALYLDPEGTRKRFIKLFNSLYSLLKDGKSAISETVVKNGNRLIHHHIRDFETENLTFIKSDIKDLELPPAKVVRCMNVLVYFEPEIRKKMIIQAGALLDHDGILIVGTNGLGSELRYAVFQKSLTGLSFKEFAFSLDNLGHIAFMPFFSIHENDPEATLLADFSRAIRSDHSFWPYFSNRIDELMKHYGICHRLPNGYLQFNNQEMQPDEYSQKNTALWNQIAKEGYVDRVVEVLNDAGYIAWKNSAEDVAVRPTENYTKSE